MTRAAVALAACLPALLTGALPAAAQTAAQQNATITITDTGYNPRAVTILLNGAVSFVNNGGNVHTATSLGGAPVPFDTGGLSQGQTTAFNFGLPGTYNFDSATDCLNGQSNPQFQCGGGTITVVQPGAAPVASAAPAAPPAAAPVAAAPGVPQSNAMVTITDAGVTPTTITINPGGSVTWVNNSSSMVHTATTTGTTPAPFDTGGLGPGQSAALVFAQSGTYTYTSATDCINRSNPGSFGCGPYHVIVTGAPVVAAPAASGAAAPVVSNTTVTIDDTNGFTPNTLTIRAGQSVTWVNVGSKVHTATSNPGYYNAWDSGGLDNKQKFTFTFTVPGTYGYHSDTEPVYGTDPNDSSIVTKSFMFNGTIVVQ